MTHATYPPSSNPDLGKPSEDSRPDPPASSQDMEALQRRVDSEVNRLSAEIASNRGQPLELLGALGTLVIVLAAVSGWLVFRVQKLENTAQLSFDPALKSQVEVLDQKLQTLDQKVSQDLVGELQATQKQLTEIEQKLKLVETTTQSLSSPAAEPPAPPSQPQAQ
ncbi:hypothetical protein C1752_07898 [Acaryochloris thomasi RCC1774]|uniref:Uncharacterized protein n=1 Tax=Acaryochloris thomasi RCC1774 TaxID=1764569 RepID=A0A2W1JAJ7_9CYAN|nr:hypothetical protein [Acaryochloris thomasi]PZD71170.1 hypothetical protein C1752_07898 [Acaryochloris thomasi RCC1774]